jgi:predicted kinase
MARWRGRRGRKKPASESDSIGRTGAALPEQHIAPLQPSYPGLEDESRQSSEITQAEPEAQEALPQENGDGGSTGPRLTRSQRRRRGRRRARERGGKQKQLTATLPPAQPIASEPSAEELPEPSAPTPTLTAAPAHPGARGVVVLAIGLPGSGKSTWFKRRGVTPLSSDILRTLLFDDISEQRFQHLVFGTLRNILRARMIARMPWNYVDATNLNARERRHWIQMAREFGYEVHAVFFDVPLQVCQERNLRRQRVVPAEVMQNMAAKLQPPKFEEGFTKITVVRVKKP